MRIDSQREHFERSCRYLGIKLPRTHYKSTCYSLGFNVSKAMLEDNEWKKYIGSSIDYIKFDDIPHFERENKMKKFCVAGDMSYQMFFYTRAEALEFMKDKPGTILYVADVTCKITNTVKQSFEKVK